MAQAQVRLKSFKLIRKLIYTPLMVLGFNFDHCVSNFEQENPLSKENHSYLMLEIHERSDQTEDLWVYKIYDAYDLIH